MTDEQIIAPLKALPDHPTPTQAADAARTFADNTRGRDAVSVASLRGEAIEILKKRGQRAPAGLLDAALKQTRAKERKKPTIRFISDPLPMAKVIDGALLARDIETAFLRYCILPKLASVFLTLWVLYSYVMNCFDHNPFLALLSPTKRCGKTRVFQVCHHLATKSYYSSDMRPSGIYRAIEEHGHPTLLLDELDAQVIRQEEYRAILNSAHTKDGAHVTRSEKDERTGQWATRDFSTYTPMGLGKIGELPATVEDRAIIVRMQRKLKSQELPEFADADRARLLALKPALVTWAAQHRGTFQRPSFPPDLDDRAKDLWRPLLTIADKLGGAWPTRAREAALRFSGPHERQETDQGVILLTDIRDVFTENKQPSEKLVGLLNKRAQWRAWNRGDGLTPSDLSTLLKGFGVYPKNIRLDTKVVVKGYTRNSFLDAWTRYGVADVAPDGGENPEEEDNHPLVPIPSSFPLHTPVAATSATLLDPGLMSQIAPGSESTPACANGVQ